MSFMKPEVYKGGYFQVSTSRGTEVVPDDIIGRVTPVHVEALLNYLEGSPDDPDEMIAHEIGWLGRMSASGYLDCASWGVYDSEDEARAELEEMYGDSDDE